jgi:hypothetical protein
MQAALAGAAQHGVRCYERPSGRDCREFTATALLEAGTVLQRLGGLNRSSQQGASNYAHLLPRRSIWESAQALLIVYQKKIAVR